MYANFWKNVSTVPKRNTALKTVVKAPAVTETPISVKLSCVLSSLVAFLLATYAPAR